MADAVHFEPIFSAHAIERCALTVGFDQALSEKTFRRIIDGLEPIASGQGLIRMPNIGINIDFATGKVVPAQGAMPETFSAPDSSTQLTITTNAIVWQTAQYIRWAPFIGQFSSLTAGVIEKFLESVSIKIVKLEYWDRFNWTGNWENLDVFSLLDKNSSLSIKAPPSAIREWHSNAGWFQQEDELRRLINFTISVADWAPALPIPPRPSVGIYTMMQDESNIVGCGMLPSDELDTKFLTERCESLHLGLKKFLGTIINTDVAVQIGLQREES